MKGRSFSKATAIFAAIAFIATAGAAGAQVDKDNAKCRSAIFKTQSKLAATAAKAVDGCWKSVLKGKLPASTDCNTPSTADTKGKIPKAQQKLLDSVGGVKSKCDDTTHAASLAMFPSCPSPANAADDGGATAGIDGFSEVGACEAELALDMVAQHRRYIMQPNAAAILALVGSADKAEATLGKQLVKCAGAISKNASKLYATVAKERGKDQAGSDQGGGPYAYGSSTGAHKGRERYRAKRVQGRPTVARGACAGDGRRGVRIAVAVLGDRLRGSQGGRRSPGRGGQLDRQGVRYR